MRERLARVIVKGIEAGEIRAMAEVSKFVIIIISLSESGIMMSKLYGDPTLLKTAQEHARQLIRGQLHAAPSVPFAHDFIMQRDTRCRPSAIPFSG